MSGDGFKNMFTFIFHYRYGNGLWFDGFMYPFGDYLVYTDAQPALCLFTKILKSVGINFTGYEVLVIQLLPLISIFVAGLLLFKIMKEFNQPTWWILLVTAGCLILSPQLHRIPSHMSLSYFFVIPLYWLMLIRYQKKNNTVRFIIIGILSLLLIGFIHAYLLLMVCLFYSAYFLVKAVIKRKADFAVIIVSLSALLLYYFINVYLDPYTDRPINPYGALQYKVERNDLFPFYGWFKYLLEGKANIRFSIFDGYCYPGILIFIAPILVLFGFIKKKQISKIEIQKIQPYFFASILVLLFAMGTHLIATDLKILEWIPPLKQFRALGRLSWPFYYVAFISLAVYFYEIFKKASKTVQIIVFGIVLLFWAKDGYDFSRITFVNVEKYGSENLFEKHTQIKDLLDLKNIPYSRYDAVLTLPTTAEGDEVFYTHDNFFVKTRTFPFAAQTGIPLMSQYMSRSSIGRSLQINQLASSDFIDKELVKEMSHTKLLMVLAKEDHDLFSHLTDKSLFIGNTKFLEIFELDLNALAEAKLLSKSKLTDFDDSKPIFYNDFENENSAVPGLLSSSSKKITESTLLNELHVQDSIYSELEFSIWLQIKPENNDVIIALVKFWDDNNKFLSEIYFRDVDFKKFEIYKNWIRLSQVIDIPDSAHKIDWYVTAKDVNVDHACIRNTNQSFVIPLESNFVLFDNYICKTELEEIKSDE